MDEDGFFAEELFMGEEGDSVEKSIPLTCNLPQGEPVTDCKIDCLATIET